MPIISVRAVGRSWLIESTGPRGLELGPIYRALADRHGPAVAPMFGDESGDLGAVIVDRQVSRFDDLRAWLASQAERAGWVGLGWEVDGDSATLRGEVGSPE